MIELVYGDWNFYTKMVEVIDKNRHKNFVKNFVNNANFAQQIADFYHLKGGLALYIQRDKNQFDHDLIKEVPDAAINLINLISETKFDKNLLTYGLIHEDLEKRESYELIWFKLFKKISEPEIPHLDELKSLGWYASAIDDCVLNCCVSSVRSNYLRNL